MASITGSTESRMSINDNQVQSLPRLFEVVIKGAGPSGLAAALSIHQALSQVSPQSPLHKFKIRIIEKRPYRLPEQGRKNIVAIRPEGLRRLDDLSVLEYLREKGWITDIEDATSVDEWMVAAAKGTDAEGVNGLSGIFSWPLGRYKSGMKVLHADQDQSVTENSVHTSSRKSKDQMDGTEEQSTFADTSSIYKTPRRVDLQVPCCFIGLGNLEDAMLHLAADKGIEVVWGSSIELISSIEHTDVSKGSTKPIVEPSYSVALVQREGEGVEGRSIRTDLGRPDLIVCASGKNDHHLAKELSFTKLIGLELQDQHSTLSSSVPPPSQTKESSNDQVKRNINVGLADEHAIESQLYSVFGVKTPAQKTGRVLHTLRKTGTGSPEQPVSEIEMIQPGVTHFLIQIPRGLDVTQEQAPPSTSSSPSPSSSRSSDYSGLEPTATSNALEGHILSRINEKLNTSHQSVEEMKHRELFVWGEPLKPVVVETATAPRYVFGDNVVLVGDAGFSCSPASGIGADIGLTVDSVNVAHLARALWDAKVACTVENDLSDDEKAKGLQVQKSNALDRFNSQKAETGVMWSKASRKFYITTTEADDILKKKQKKNKTKQKG